MKELTYRVTVPEEHSEQFHWVTHVRKQLYTAVGRAFPQAASSNELLERVYDSMANESPGIPALFLSEEIAELNQTGESILNSPDVKKYRGGLTVKNAVKVAAANEVVLRLERFIMGKIGNTRDYRPVTYTSPGCGSLLVSEPTYDEIVSTSESLQLLGEYNGVPYYISDKLPSDLVKKTLVFMAENTQMPAKSDLKMGLFLPYKEGISQAYFHEIFRYAVVTDGNVADIVTKFLELSRNGVHEAHHSLQATHLYSLLAEIDAFIAVEKAYRSASNKSEKELQNGNKSATVTFERMLYEHAALDEQSLIGDVFCDMRSRDMSRMLSADHNIANLKRQNDSFLGVVPLGKNS